MNTLQFVLWDMRGKGLTERFEPEEISFDAYQRDVEAVVDHFSPDRPVVFIGHSFGGTFAVQYMNAHPDRVAGAVFLESGAFSSDEVIVESDLKIYREWVNDLAWCHQLINADSHETADFNQVHPPSFSDSKSRRRFGRERRRGRWGRG